jgi:hypothetical protein
MSRRTSLLRSVDRSSVIRREFQRMQGANPFAGYQPYESESDSESESESSSSSESDDHDERLSALDAWRTQGQAWLAGPSRYTVPEGPGRPDNRLGMWNTAFEYAEERRTSVLMLDSLDRDQAAYPLPTSLRLKLPRVYRNVERIDICQIKFLNGLYAISAERRNNKLPWILDDGSGAAVIPDGTYTGQQLVDALTAELPAAIQITYNCTKGRFILDASSSTSFELPWLSNATNMGPTDWGLGWNLGFGGPAADLSGSLVYMASHMPRLFDDYVFLRLNDAEKMNDVDHTDLENVAVAQDSTGQVGHYFGKLLLNNFGCWSQTFIEAPKRFRPVLGRLERLNVDWVDRHGVPLVGVDAATCDWHMTVRITEIVEGPSTTSSLAMSRAQQQNSGPPIRGQ